MSAAPAPTVVGHGWGCNACGWTGRTLADAKIHLMAPRSTGIPHYPFEMPLASLGDAGKVGMTAKGATRVMYPHKEDPTLVRVVTWATAQKQFRATADPLVASSVSRDPRRRG